MALPGSGAISISSIKSNIGSSSYSLGTLAQQVDKGSPYTMSSFYNYGIVSSGLVLWLDGLNDNSYPESGTTFYDISGNGNTHSFTTYSGGSAASYNSLGGGSIRLYRDAGYSGSTIVPSSSSFAQLTSAVTLSVWLYANTSSVMIVAGKGFRTSSSAEYQSYQIYTNGTSMVGRITAGGATSNTDISAPFSLNSWIMVTLTYDGSNMYLYMNSTLGNSSGKTGTMTNNNSFNFAVGGQWNYNSSPVVADFFSGYIGQVALYNRALSSSEVTANFNNTKSRFGY